MFKILTEASGGLTSAFLIKAIKESGYKAVASDIDIECVGKYLADDFIHIPSVNDPELWSKITYLLKNNNINIVIPSLDESLLGWAERKSFFLEQGIFAILSDTETISICQDKWLTYKFFIANNIPTPKTSLEQIYPLLKPRNGRGGMGIKLTSITTCMEGMISQELLKGEEYTVDVLCDNFSNPIYIVPRKRLAVRNGKSTRGIVVNHLEIIRGIKNICRKLSFKGPINIQCFDCKEKGVLFTEINPRIAGGMALGFAATENWIKPIINHFIYHQEILPKPIKYGLQMRRYYAEIFIPGN